MFGANRIFSQRNNDTGQVEWFFMAREGVFGPFPTKELLLERMREFTDKCKKANDDGGRDDSHNKLSLAPIKNGAVFEFFDPYKRKKGKDG